MSFDPDKYLAKKSASSDVGFNPDAYLNQGFNDKEMHQDISLWDRAKVKMFSNSPEVTVDYFKRQFPDADVVAKDGNIFMKRKGEKEYKALDPNTGFFSSDIINDATDLAYDVGDAAFTTGATALGALGGFVGGGGVGAVPGAVGAGALSSAASEAARQKIGQKLGLNQDVDGWDVAIAGGVGAASPLLFGAGAPIKASAKQVAKNALTKTGKELAQEQAEALVKDSSRGLLERANKKTTEDIAPWIGEKLSGRTRESIKNYANNIDYVDKFETGEKSFLDELESFIANTKGKFYGKQNEVGSRLSKDIKGAGRKVDMTQAISILDEEIDRIQKIADLEEAAGGVSKVTAEQLNRAKSLKDDIFGKNFGPEIDAELAWVKKQQTGKAAEVNRMTDGITSRLPSGTYVDDRMLKNSALQTYKAIDDAINAATNSLSSVSSAEYAELKRIQSILAPVFKDEKTALRTLRNLDSESQTVIVDAIKKAQEMGIDINDDALKIMAAAQWSKPASVALSAGGSTSTSRTIPAAVIGGSLGSLAGYQMGGGYTGATVGGGVGAAAGAFLGGPAAIKAAIKLNRAAKKFSNNYIAPVIPRQQVLTPAGTVGAKGIWDLMREEEERRVNTRR